MRTFIHEFTSELIHATDDELVRELLRPHLGDALDGLTIKVLSPQDAANVLRSCASSSPPPSPERPDPLRALLVELVQGSPELVRELLRPHIEADLGPLKAEPFSLDLLQALPKDHRPDHAVVLRDEAGKAVRGIVVDVQMHVDSRKPWLWPVYMTAASSALQCPISLLVIAPDPHVARWVRTPGKSGVRSFVKPIAISYRDVPRIILPETARQLPELGVLSALAHSNAEVVRATAAGLVSLGESPRARRYREALRQLLPARLLVELEVAWASAAGEQESRAAKPGKSGRRSKTERSERAGCASPAVEPAEDRAAEVDQDEEQDEDENAREDDDEEDQDEEDDFDFDEFLAQQFARLREREPLERYLKSLAKHRIGALSRDDEMAVGMASGKDESAIQMVLRLAEAKTAEEAREAIHEAAIGRLDATREAERKG